MPGIVKSVVFPTPLRLTGAVQARVGLSLVAGSSLVSEEDNYCLGNVQNLKLGPRIPTGGRVRPCLVRNSTDQSCPLDLPEPWLRRLPLQGEAASSPARRESVPRPFPDRYSGRFFCHYWSNSDFSGNTSLGKHFILTIRRKHCHLLQQMCVHQCTTTVQSDIVHGILGGFLIFSV